MFKPPLDWQRDTKDGTASAGYTAAPPLNSPAVTVNNFSHDPKPKAISFGFVAFKGIEERLPHRLRNPRSIVSNRDYGASITHGYPHVEVPGMRERLDGVEQKIRDHLENFALLNERRCYFRSSGLNLDPFL